MKYWAYMDGEVTDGLSAEELAALPGFSAATLICPARDEMAEKDWRRASEFTGVVDAIAARERAESQPSPPTATPTPPTTDLNTLIDTTSTKLFSHVAELMIEIQTQREHKALVASLQHQIAALKEEADAARQRAELLEARLPRMAELQEAAKHDRAALESAQSGLVERERELIEARAEADKIKAESASLSHRLHEAVDSLAARDEAVTQLTGELHAKELSLAKSLGVIRRLEEDLKRLLRPLPVVLPSLEADAAPSSEEPLLPLDAAPPTSLEPSSPADGSQALNRFLKKFFPDDPH